MELTNKRSLKEKISRLLRGKKYDSYKMNSNESNSSRHKKEKKEENCVLEKMVSKMAYSYDTYNSNVSNSRGIVSAEKPGVWYEYPEHKQVRRRRVSSKSRKGEHSFARKYDSCDMKVNLSVSRPRRRADFRAIQNSNASNNRRRRRVDTNFNAPPPPGFQAGPGAMPRRAVEASTSTSTTVAKGKVVENGEEKEVKWKRKKYFCCGPELSESEDDPLDPREKTPGGGDGPLLGWTPEPQSYEAVIPTPMGGAPHPETPAEVPGIHIRATPAEIVSPPVVVYKPMEFVVDEGLLMVVDDKQHIGGFLLPPEYCQTLFDKMDLWRQTNTDEAAGINNDVVVRITNIMTWHKTRLNRFVAVIGKGPNSAEDVKDALHKIFGHFDIANRYGIFDSESKHDREVTLKLKAPSEMKYKKEANIFYKWLGESGLRSLFVDPTLTRQPISISTAAPIYIHNSQAVGEGQEGAIIAEEAAASATLASSTVPSD